MTICWLRFGLLGCFWYQCKQSFKWCGSIGAHSSSWLWPPANTLCTSVIQSKITAFAKWKFIYTQLCTNKNHEACYFYRIQCLHRFFDWYNTQIRQRWSATCWVEEEYKCVCSMNVNIDVFTVKRVCVSVCVREKEWLAYSIIIRHPKFNSFLLCVSPSCRDSGLLLMYLLILAADGIVLCCNILIRWKKCRGIVFSMHRRCCVPVQELPRWMIPAAKMHQNQRCHFV